MIPNTLQNRKLRIFVASPKDVETERERLKSVVSELNYSGNVADWLGLRLEVLDWRTHVSPLMGRPEGVVLDQIPVETWDIFVGILWLRFGAPTGAINPQTGRVFTSGTQEEFSLAYNSWKNSGFPQILFYRCMRVPLNIDDIDPEQHKQVKAFFAQFDADSKHPGLYRSFQAADEFERFVRNDLTRLLFRYGKDVLKKEPPQSVVDLALPTTIDRMPRRASFFGRKDEISKILMALSPEDRGWGMVLEGIGGIGKTALAVEAAYICKDQALFDAFVFVSAKRERLEWDEIKQEATAVLTLDGFINETARAIGQPGIAKLSEGEPKRRALLDALQDMRVLLVFDNLETLSHEEQNAISDFLRKLPQDCKAILTSRERFAESAVSLPVRELKWEDAQELIRDQLAHSATNLHALSLADEVRWKELYDVAGGSPLAILWAIGLIRSRGLAFNRALEFLRSGNAETDLNVFIYREAWRRMRDNERIVLGALSLFDGLATLEALMATTPFSKGSIDSILVKLRVLNLIEVTEVKTKSGRFDERYTLHPLTQGYAKADLARDAGTAYMLKMRFARYWKSRVEQYASTRKDDHMVYDQLGEEWDNLEAAANCMWDLIAINSAQGQKDAALMLIDLGKILRQFILVGGHNKKSERLIVSAFEAAKILKNWKEAGWFAYYIAWIKYASTNTAEAKIWSDKCVDAWSFGGDGREKAFGMRMLGLIAGQQGDFPRSEELLREALTTWLDLGLEKDMMIVLNDLADLSKNRGNPIAAESYYHEALRIAEQIGSKDGEAVGYANLGQIAVERGKWMEAHDLLHKSLSVSRELGYTELIGGVEANRVKVWEMLGRPDLALESAKAALFIYERLHRSQSLAMREIVGRLECQLSQSRFEGE